MVVPPGNGFANGDQSSNNSPLQLAASTTVSQNIPKKLLIFWDTVLVRNFTDIFIFIFFFLILVRCINPKTIQITTTSIL